MNPIAHDSGFDFFDLETFSRGAPYAAFAELRRRGGIHWQRAPDGSGFWLVTSHALLVEVSKRAEDFHSNSGTVLVDHPPADAPPPWTMVKNEFCSLDGSKHRSYRRIATPPFAPKALAALQPKITQAVSTVLDEALEHETIDVAEDIAVRLATTIVLCHLLGLPEQDRHRAAFWSDLISAPDDPQFRQSHETATTAIAEMYDYATELVRDRRENPRDDLASALALSQLDGELITEDTFTHFFWSMILGSFDTTASTIASAFEAIETHPEQWARVVSGEVSVESAVEEMLRWASPVVYFRRTATHDTELAGMEILEGQKVALCYPAANRDPDVFPEPDAFDVGRTSNDHVSFGYGVHFCLGARLARMELCTLFEEIVRRSVTTQATDEIRRTRSNFLNRICHYPARIYAKQGATS